jgi:hypothetical protein
LKNLKRKEESKDQKVPKMSKPITPSMDRFPGIFTGPSAWLGKDMALAEDRWLYQLSEQDISDLEAAAGHCLQSSA